MPNKKKQYKYPKNWFKNNIIAVPGGITGNCSACIFRGMDSYCDKMICTYLDEGTDNMVSVYWIGTETHANIALWPELVNFFNTVPKYRIREISYGVMKSAVLKQSQNSR